MIREGNDPVVIQSSIALLQERFRQLQRMKEMREERQLLKLLTAMEDNKAFGPSPPQHYEPSSLGLFCHPPQQMANHPTATSLPQLSLSLWPIPRDSLPYSRCSDAPALPKSWLVEKQKQKPCFLDPTKFKDLAHLDEVDTSLHL